MNSRKYSDSLCIQAVLRTHTEPHVVFAMSREGLYCTSNHQTCPEINAAPSHLHVSHEVPHCKWLHSPGHLLLTAMETGFALELNNHGVFHPSSSVTLPRAASPVLFAFETPSPTEKTPVFTEPFRHSMGLQLPAKFTLTY